MTGKHRDPEYLRNAKIVRAQVQRAWRLGDDVHCWRCTRVLEPGTPFDVGHLHPDGGPGLDNLAPEHRHRVSGCRGNRSAGGQLGAAITNGRRARAASPRSRGLLGWRVADVGERADRSFFAGRGNPRLRLHLPNLPLNRGLA